MKLHNATSTAGLLGWVAVAALCAGPMVASAEDLTPHYGYQYRDFNFPYDYSNNNSNNNNYDNNNNNYDDNNNNDDNNGGNSDVIISDGDPLLPAVPEPGTLALSLAGLAGLLAVRLRRRSK